MIFYQLCMVMVPKIDNPIRSVQFVVDNYNLGLTRLENPDIKNKNSKSIIVSQTSNDVVDLLGFLSLPEPYFSYSRINLNTASIYQRSNLHKFNYFYFKILKPGGIIK